MKYFLYSGLVIGVALFNVLVNAKLTAVSPFDGLQDLYQEVRSRQTYQSALFTTPLGLALVCREIISSGYFGENKRISITSLITFALIYKKAHITHSKTKETIVENGFPCRTHNEDIHTFYVSEEYDLNMDHESSPSHKYIGGRFIFEYWNDRFHLTALAEEPAQRSTISKYDLQLFYFSIKSREDYKPATNASEDPLCKLDGRRICNVILNSSKLVPYSKIEAQPCAKKTVYLPHRYHREWILHCRAPGESIYLSRAYNSNHLIGYELIKKRMFLKNLYYNISGVIDEPNVMLEK